MIDGIPAWVGLASPVSATLVVFWLVFTGRLWTKAAHDDVVRVLQNRNQEVITDRNSWQAAATLANKTGADLADTNKALIETARFSTHVMSALQNHSGGDRPHVPSKES